MEKDFLILVDENDRPWGKLEKQLVHEIGLLHRAFSVFILNSKGEMLLQQRAAGKYHSGRLWTNACCSHPRFGEDLADAVNRRLKEEMGLECTTHFAFRFQYSASFENSLIENELDHVYIGICDKHPVVNPEEVMNWKYESIASIKSDFERNPSHFTVWFKKCFDKVVAHLINEAKLNLTLNTEEKITLNYFT